MPKVEKRYTSLYKEALAFNQMGWSCIPLRGDNDPTRAKAPALSTWKVYQTRLPAASEIEKWFQSEKHPVAGIVLGKVSGIVVIDIDSPEMAHSFVERFPALTNTFMVQSGNRHLPHYYFAIESNQIVSPLYGDGIELKADGQYVVAPHSVINGNCWQVINQKPLLKLSEADLSELVAFIRSSSLAATQSSCEPICVEKGRSQVSDSYLVGLYHKLANSIGRNNALFRAGCVARDYGWNQQMVEQLFVGEHIKRGIAESESQRRSEAQRTIVSVFSRPARKANPIEFQETVPNALREHFLQSGLDHVARVLDGMLMAGFCTGDMMTADSVYHRLKTYGIGRNTIYAAMRDGNMVFDSPHTPQRQTAIAVKPSRGITNQCLIGRDSNPVKIAGRKKNYFVMPDMNQLCERLNLENKGGDPLFAEDLKSPRAYRAALHKALIERSPGIYPRRWLAKRLGVSKTTCRRYERQTRIRVMQTYHSQRLQWHNLDVVLPEEPAPGQFIQDDLGRRFPAISSIARRLLSKKLTVFFRHQDANHYSVERQPQANSALQPEPTTHRFPKPLDEVPVFSVDLFKPSNAAMHIEHPNQHHQTALRVEQVCQITVDIQERVYRVLRDLNPKRAMTRKRISALFERYGSAMLERALKVLKSTSDVRNPAGFLIGWLRHQCGETVAKLSDSHSDAEDWLTRFEQSPYAQYCVF